MILGAAADVNLIVMRNRSVPYALTLRHLGAKVDEIVRGDHLTSLLAHLTPRRGGVSILDSFEWIEDDPGANDDE